MFLEMFTPTVRFRYVSARCYQEKLVPLLPGLVMFRDKLCREWSWRDLFFA